MLNKIPMELIDIILDYIGHERERDRVNVRSVSLVARRLAVPCQRRLFKNFRLREGVPLHEFPRRIIAAIQFCTLTDTYGEGGDARVCEFVAQLAELRMFTLWSRKSDQRPFYSRQLEGVLAASRVTRLNVYVHFECPVSLLSCCPNLTHLDIQLGRISGAKEWIDARGGGVGGARNASLPAYDCASCYEGEEDAGADGAETGSSEGPGSSPSPSSTSESTAETEEILHRPAGPSLKWFRCYASAFNGGFWSPQPQLYGWLAHPLCPLNFQGIQHLALNIQQSDIYKSAGELLGRASSSLESLELTLAQVFLTGGKLMDDHPLLLNFNQLTQLRRLRLVVLVKMYDRDYPSYFEWLEGVLQSLPAVTQLEELTIVLAFSSMILDEVIIERVKPLDGLLQDKRFGRLTKLHLKLCVDSYEDLEEKAKKEISNKLAGALPNLAKKKAFFTTVSKVALWWGSSGRAEF